MSGDVQPRKRKDKRRKKEGTSLGAIHEPVISPKYKRSESEDLKVFDVPDQGEKIHVQNEHGIGGNICVKIIFFCLFGLLIGAVGLIYMQSQGSTDVDLPTIEESRFAEYFTGWLDDSTDDHEHEPHDNVDHDEHDEHDEHEENEEHDDHDDHDDEEEEHEEEDESAEQVSDPIYKLFGLQSNDDDDDNDGVEEDDAKSKSFIESESRHTHDVDEDEDDEGVEEHEEEEEEQEPEKEDTEEEEEEEEEEENDVNDTEEDDEEKNDVDDAEEEEEKDKDEEDNDSGVDLNEHDIDDEDDDDDGDDLFQMDEEDEEKYETKKTVKRWWEESPAESKRKVTKEDDDDEDNDEESKENLSAEKQLEEDNEDEDQQDDTDGSDEVENDDKQEEDDVEKEEPKFKAETDDLGFDEIDVSEEDLGTENDVNEKDQDEENDNQLNKDSYDEDGKESGIEKEEEETETDTEGGVAIKLGVGIALIIVAHLVLVKKWKSMNNVPSDENVPTVAETPLEKKVIENLQSEEPVISRRQTLVPENVSLNGEFDEEDEEEEEGEEEEEQEEDEEEEEGAEDDEAYSEEDREEEEYKKEDKWETFEKPSWSIRKEDKEEERDVDNEEEAEYDEEYEEEDAEEVEDEQEQEEEDEEEVDDEEEEEYEEDEEDVEEDKDVLKKKLPAAVPDKRQEEVKETPPTPPPRNRPGRGAQEVEEDYIEFQEVNNVEETSQHGHKAFDEVNINSIPEEEKTPESKKVGNEDEWAFRQELDFADEQFENNPKAALGVYDKIVSKKPTLIKALIGRAKALDHLAEKEKSNSYLKQATNAYKTVLFNHGDRLDDDTYLKLAERCIERMRFAGNFISAIEVHKALILKYPNAPKYRNGLAVTYLMLNKIPQARVILNETLNLWPDNGFALVHYGFILKTSDNNMEEGAKKLMAGIQTREEGVIDGMFFFHLGDALNRLGREKEAMKWYELGVKEGLFLSKYQRSLYNVNRLKGQPWWTKEETTYQEFFKKLEDNWREIRREGLELLNSRGVNLFKEEAENLKDTGDWKQLDLYFRGRKQANCNKAPVTCALVSSFKPASTCTRGQIKFSVMLPNTHVWPHCGPTNCRLRSHLGLVVPKKTFIRVAEETRSWEEGKFIIFDDSFEHEVWHNGTGPRLVLIVDVWHPELTNHERRVLSPI